MPCAFRDAKGNYLDGGKTYKVTLPGPVPAKNFWSFMVYDNQTRSLLETDQKPAGVDSTVKDLKMNADGSVTVWFGPKAPEGQEGNWVQTMPGKGFNVAPAALRPAGALVRQELETRRSGTGGIGPAATRTARRANPRGGHFLTRPYFRHPNPLKDKGSENVPARDTPRPKAPDRSGALHLEPLRAQFLR